MLFVAGGSTEARSANSLKNLFHISFEFETGGSKIAVSEPEADPSGS